MNRGEAEPVPPKGVTVYSTFIIERYCYMMRDSRLPCGEYSQRMFRFSHLLIRELIKGLI